MTLSHEERLELVAVCKPLMEWLGKNCHPHVKVLVDSEVAELVEGVATAHRTECWDSNLES